MKLIHATATDPGFFVYTRFVPATLIRSAVYMPLLGALVGEG